MYISSIVAHIYRCVQVWRTVQRNHQEKIVQKLNLQMIIITL